MCGYCTEQIALNALNVSNISDAPTATSSLLDWGLYLEEIRDLPSALLQLPMQSAVKPYIASVIMCRAIETFAVYGFESDVYQELLQQPKFTYAISVACAEGKRSMLSDLDIHFNTSSFVWLAEEDTYLKQGSFEQQNNGSIDQSCISLLSYYIGWWLEGGSVPLNDIIQIFEDTGIADSIDTISETNRSLLERRFAILWFALLRVACLPDCAQIVWAIITRSPSGTPNFNGLDLWLQRRATLAVYDRQGLAPFLSKFQLVRPELFQFLAAARTIKTEEKNAFMEQVAISGEYNCEQLGLDEWYWATDPQS